MENLFIKSLKKLLEIIPTIYNEDKQNKYSVYEKEVLNSLHLCTSVSLIDNSELENLYKALSFLHKINDERFDDENIQTQSEYDLYIQICSFIKYPENTKLEDHHILPRHAGGSDDKINLIPLSIPHHAIAHWLLWRLYNNENDKRAFFLKVSVNSNYQSLRSQLLQEDYKKYNRLRYNSEYQREMGKKGGKIGGSANTQKQFEARQKVGKFYGAQVGISNQTDDLKTFLSKYSIWQLTGYFDKDSFKSYGTRKLDEKQVNFFFILYPKISFAELQRTLQLLFPSTHNYYKLLDLVPRNGKAKRNSRYGFRLYDTPTRSETEEGDLKNLDSIVKNIREIFPNSSIIHESDIVD